MSILQAQGEKFCQDKTQVRAFLSISLGYKDLKPIYTGVITKTDSMGFIISTIKGEEVYIRWESISELRQVLND